MPEVIAINQIKCAMKKYLFMVTAALVLTIQTKSQTIINAGPVSGTWTAAGSPYHIMGDINIPTGNNLVIEPGVAVKFFNEVSFKIYGNLKAIGSQSNQILFTLGATYCKGIQIWNANDTCKFVYCKFINFSNRSEIETGNIKGGSVFAKNSKIQISNSIFTNNKILLDVPGSILNGFGGAIYIETCVGYLKNSYLANNVISYLSSSGFWYETIIGKGGAIFVDGQNFIIDTNQFLENKVDLYIFGIEEYSECYGGGIYSNGQVLNNIVQNNSCECNASGQDYSGMSFGFGSAKSFGGGIYGGIVIKNTITNNSCSSDGSGSGSMGSGGNGHAESNGGGIYGAILVNSNIISNNNCISDAYGYSYQGSAGASAISQGGGISFSSQITNNLIYSNNCESEAEAYSTWQYNSSATSLGGGLYGGNGINNTILWNQVHINAGITTEINGSGVYSGALKNCIIYNNTGASQISDAAVTYSCVQGGYSGQGNISSDPLFVNPSQNDYHLKQPPCQVQHSPCVDAGDPLSPLLQGTTRTDEYPDLDTIDMGFHYELTNPIVIADFYSDIQCGVTPFDVNFFDDSYHYQTDSVKFEWDFENDGLVDSYEMNPLWTFIENGVYSVKHKVIGYVEDTVFMDSILKVDFISAFAKFNLIAGFAENKTYGDFPLLVHFYDTSQLFPNGIINLWKWDFNNDGQIDALNQNPFFEYNEHGQYSVKLIVGNSILMIFDTVLKQDYITVCQIVPGFYAQPLSGDVPLEVDFIDTSLVEYTQISTWKWDFQNDGLIDAYGPNPTWTYPEAGIYSVKLLITDTSEQIWKSVINGNYIQVNSITGSPKQPIENINSRLIIFPNPFTSDLIIEFDFDKPEEVTVQIFDIAFTPVVTIAKDEKVTIGKKSWKWKSRDNNIPSGIYYISLTITSDKQLIKKCIKVE